MVTEKLINKYKEYIGKDFGCIHVDDIDLSKANENRIYFYCTCNKCGHKFKVRNDGLTNGKKERIACKYCIGKWRKEHFEELDRLKPIPKDIRNKRTHFRVNAEIRGINFELTNEQVLDICSKPCFYCGKERCLGIDRIDNSKGYIIDNCVPCCGCCNKMKMDLSLKFFCDQIEKIYNRLDTIKSSSTISKESTSEAIADGNGVHLKFKRDGDIVRAA